MPVTASCEQLLAELERQAQADGAGLDEIDARVADALEVPRSYYFAYLLVRNAVEARCQALEPRGAHDAGGDSAALARAGALVHRMGAHAGELYRQTATGPDGPSSGCHDPAAAYRPGPGGARLDRFGGGIQPADHASRILAGVVTLRGLLRDAHHGQPTEPSDHAARLESVGVVGRG